jgi:hypothetical protein
LILRERVQNLPAGRLAIDMHPDGNAVSLLFAAKRVEPFPQQSPRRCPGRALAPQHPNFLWSVAFKGEQSREENPNS